MQQVYPRGHIIERFPIWPRREGNPGPQWQGLLIQGAERPSHRIIKVLDENGAKLWEGGGYDHANAVNRLEWWLAAVADPTPELLARFEAGQEFRPDCIEGEYWKAWKAKQAAIPPIVATKVSCDHCGQFVEAADMAQVTAEDKICGKCVAKVVVRDVLSHVAADLRAAAEEDSAACPATAHQQFIDAVEADLPAAD